jgi:hypothetical protein
MTSSSECVFFLKEETLSFLVVLGEKHIWLEMRNIISLIVERPLSLNSLRLHSFHFASEPDQLSPA